MMKRLIFLIWLLMPVIALANNSNVVIGDSTFFNYTHTTAIDSAQLILIRGAVKDTLSLMPITGSSHKIVEWEDIFNQVDSAGTYQVWIEPYSSAAIIDTMLGVCQVELAPLVANDVWNASNSIVVTKGDVDSTVAGNKWLISRALTQANNYWNENIILFFTGTAAGQVARIVAFVAVNDSVTFTPELTVAPAVGDSFMILGMLSETRPDTWWNEGKTGYALSPSGIDGIWDEDTTGHKTDPQMGYWITQGGTASIPDSLLEIINEIKAMATLAGVGDSIQVRYIDDDGTDADGLTPATAWDNFDSVKTLTSPTVVLVSGGTYASTVCSVEVSGISIIGVDGPGVTFVRGTADTVAFATERVFNINPGAEAILKGFRLSGLNIAHRVPNTAADPGFKNAIWVHDSTEYVEIDHCVFPDSNYKTIATGDDWVRFVNIHDNWFYGNKIHSIDVASAIARIHNNFFVATKDTASVGVQDAIQIYTKGKYVAVYDNYFIDHQNAVSLIGADSNLVVSNYSGVTSGTHFISNVNSGGNTYADNWGANLSLKGRDAGGNQPNTVQEEVKDFREQDLMNPLPGSIIPNGHLQVDWNADSTDVAGWGVISGTGYLTSRRRIEGYERSLYFNNGSIITGKLKLDTGYYELAAQIFFGGNTSTLDTAFFQCYNSANEQQNWLSSGTATEHITGWNLAWHRFARLIHLTGDSTFYFSMGADAGDSAYFAEVSLMPYGAVGHTITASSAWSTAEKDSAMAALFDYGTAVSGGSLPFLTRMLIGYPNATPGWDTLSNSVTSMIGLYDGTAGYGNLEDELDSLGLHIGRDGSSTERVSLHMKIGSYVGGSGDDKNIKDDIDAIDVGSGTGVNVCSLWVYDTGNTVMVSDIMVQAENASGANQGRDRTNTTGISILNLNDGSYNLRIPMNSGYIQTTNPQPFTVSGATNDTVEVTLFTPTAPAGDLCTVYNWIVDGNDNPIANANVSAEIPMEFWPVTYGGKAISARHSVRTDSTGKYELPIFPSTIVLTAQGDSASYWMIDARHRGQEIFKHKVTVPDSTTFLMVPDDD